MIGWTVDAQTHNGSIGNADMYPVVQYITEGDNDWNRDGDRIKPKSLVVRGTVGLVPSGSQPNNKPLYARIIIASQVANACAWYWSRLL